jgi:nucleolar pre-ribosomal-associated protein 1
LNQLRSQLTIRSDEGTVPPQDERLSLVEHWLAKNPGAQDVFGIWENANPVSITSFFILFERVLNCRAETE